MEVFQLTFHNYTIILLYINIPKDHQSTSKLCPFYLIISGAKYSGVPTKENVFSPYFKNLANP